MKKLALALFLLLATAPLTVATSLRRMDLDDLTAESQTIVYARIAGNRTEWDSHHKVIYTIYTIQPLQYLKGQLGPSFELRELGGVKGGLMMMLPSVPVFSVGQEQVLFVWTDPQGRHQVIGFEQGALGVHTDPLSGQKVVERSLRLGSARSAPRGPSSGPSTSQSLPRLFDQIRSSAAKASMAGSTARNPQ